MIHLLSLKSQFLIYKMEEFPTLSLLQCQGLSSERYTQQYLKTDVLYNWYIGIVGTKVKSQILSLLCLLLCLYFNYSHSRILIEKCWVFLVLLLN